MFSIYYLYLSHLTNEHFTNEAFHIFPCWSARWNAVSARLGAGPYPLPSESFSYLISRPIDDFVFSQLLVHL